MTDEPLKEEDREDLVAYLDGELDEEAARQVEERISLDPKARAEADALKKAWDLLDYLPKPEPSPNFTHRTLSQVAALRPKKTQPLTVPRWRRWAVGLGWAAAVLLAAAVGYFGFSRLYPPDRTDEELARDLRVIENRRLYEPVDDIDFLWQLDQPDLFGEDNAGG
jgi:negative regulator of sigma E activity